MERAGTEDRDWDWARGYSELAAGGAGDSGVFVRVGGDSIRLWTAYYIAGEGACTAAKVGACAECDGRSKAGCMALGEQPGSHVQARGQRTVSTLGWLREKRSQTAAAGAQEDFDVGDDSTWVARLARGIGRRRRAGARRRQPVRKQQRLRRPPPLPRPQSRRSVLGIPPHAFVTSLTYLTYIQCQTIESAVYLMTSRCVWEREGRVHIQPERLLRTWTQSSEAPSPNDDGTSQAPAVGKPGRKKNPKYGPSLLSVLTQAHGPCVPP